eukprot:Pgem_evm1s8479
MPNLRTRERVPYYVEEEEEEEEEEDDDDQEERRRTLEAVFGALGVGRVRYNGKRSYESASEEKKIWVKKKLADIHEKLVSLFYSDGDSEIVQARHLKVPVNDVRV